MKKLFNLLFVTLLLFIINPSQAQTDAQKAQIRVHITNANSALQNSNWDQALSNVNKAQDVLGSSAAIFESIRIKAYHGKKDYQKAKEHLLIFFQLSPADNLIDEIAPISADIDEEIEKEKVRKKEAEKEKQRALAKKLENDKRDKAIKKGDALVDDYQFEEAIKSYKIALKIKRTAALESKLRMAESKKNTLFKDPRDSKIYKTVKIGNQVWFAENVQYKGNIPNIIENEEWANLTSPAWSYYNNDISNNGRHGKLYNWYAIKNTKLCPAGWHIPSKEEWGILINYLGGNEIAGEKMKSDTDWNHEKSTIKASNLSGFTALQSGGRENSGFRLLDIIGIWWSATEENSSNAWYVDLTNYTNTIVMDYGSKQMGASCRCVKD